MLGLGTWLLMIRMPGRSHRGPLPPLSTADEDLREALRRDVQALAEDIGERNLPRHEALVRAAAYIEMELRATGLEPRRQTIEARGSPCDNIDVEIPGASDPGEIVVVGAHYDSVLGSPGANDNASGCAAVLALARAFAGQTSPRTLRLAFFVNEEPPYFQEGSMGSLAYAARCRERRERVVAMMSIETIGYYSDEEGSQAYPMPFSLFYPARGDFIGFVGNIGSRGLVHRAIASFREHASFPSEGVAAPEIIPGIGWSDQWSFWRHGYRAIMVTDTAPFRYPYYHTGKDAPDKLDYERMARVVRGLEAVIRDLLGPD